jgi:hypothetical protein
MELDKDAPIWTLTVGQFTELMNSLTPKKEEPDEQVQQFDKYSYGLSGLSTLLDCCKTTAWKIKDSGKIDKAIRQVGRKIIVDNEKALELLGRKNQNPKK